jgi:ABC-type sugar transport system substrate-binding protein
MSNLLGPHSVQLVDVRNLDWTEEGALAALREFVHAGQRVDAVWAANDQMAFGAITALREAGYKPVGGFSWSQCPASVILLQRVSSSIQTIPTRLGRDIETIQKASSVGRLLNPYTRRMSS